MLPKLQHTHTHTHTHKTAQQPPHLWAHKVPRVSSGSDQSLQIDLLEQSVNTDAQSQGEQKFLTSPVYKILQDVEVQKEGGDLKNIVNFEY